MPLEDWHDAHAGWLNVLLPLKAWVQPGAELRTHEPRRTWVRGYLDQ